MTFLYYCFVYLETKVGTRTKGGGKAQGEGGWRQSSLLPSDSLSVSLSCLLETVYTKKIKKKEHIIRGCEDFESLNTKPIKGKI